MTDQAEQPAAEMLWPLPDGVVLAGDWVELRRIDEADAAGLVAALSDPVVSQHSTSDMPRDVDAMRERIRGLPGRGVHAWTVRLRRPLGGFAPDDVAGWTSYLEVEQRDARIEIGYTAYAPAVWGTQVNPECKLLLLSYAFDTLRCGRVQLKTDARNARSRAAIAKLGAVQEGILRRYQRRRDGTVRDSVLFSITADEWPSVRTGLEARL